MVGRACKRAVSELMLEFDTGGNVRFEEGRPGDVWFSSCADLVKSRVVSRTAVPGWFLRQGEGGPVPTERRQVPIETQEGFAAVRRYSSGLTKHDDTCFVIVVEVTRVAVWNMIWARSGTSVEPCTEHIVHPKRTPLPIYIAVFVPVRVCRLRRPERVRHTG